MFNVCNSISCSASSHTLVTIPYCSEFHCPIGTAEKIALFYESVLDAITTCIDLGDGTKIAIIAFGNVDDTGKADQSLLFRESEGEVPEYDGHHIAMYVGESAADYEQVSTCEDTGSFYFVGLYVLTMQLFLGLQER